MVVYPGPIHLEPSQLKRWSNARIKALAGRPAIVNGVPHGVVETHARRVLPFARLVKLGLADGREDTRRVGERRARPRTERARRYLRATRELREGSS